MTDVAQAHADNGGVQVIGAGFGRTGTLSLKAALETLGFGPCYHMVEVFARPEHVPMWRAAAAGQPVDWHGLFAAYRATVDWPACAFYSDLMDAFPEARVILTVRDPERWYESARATIYRVRNPGGGLSGAAMRAMFMLGRLLVPRMRTAPAMINEVIWQGTFDGRFEDREHAIAIYQKHNEEVKRRVPPEKLLVYQVSQGWEPLCAFLGVDMPADTPFPHLNDRDSFGPRTMRRLLTQRQGAAAD
jgi:hypothetical protein